MSLETVSVERDGRTLSGVGASADALEAVLDRHLPESEPSPDGTLPAGSPVAAAETSAPAQGEPKPARGRERFSQLTRERDDAKQAAETARQELETLRRERDELRARSTPAPSAPSAPAAPAEPTYTRPEPREDEVGTKYDTYAAFTRDQAKWVLEQEQASFDTRISQQIAAERSARQFQDTVRSSHERARKVYADFDQLLASGPGALVPLGRSPQEAMERAHFVITHPHSEHLQYAILRDGALAARLQQMDPYSFGLALASLVPASGAVPASPVSAVTHIPAPMQPVGSGSTTATPSSADLVKRGGFDFDKSGYREKRAAERGGSRRR